MSTHAVSLVIPGRNCERTIRRCLEAACAIAAKEGSPLREIIFVDDGSTDATAAIVAEFPVSLIRGEGRGPGAARNAGWRAATNPLIWFVDSDCVAEPDALAHLLPHLDDPKVGGVSGSYGIMNPHSLLARLIHEEIIQRHLAMPVEVNFLATFNVLYRREALERVGGLDERFLKGQDAELSFRVMEAGYTLHFEIESRVRHFHEERLLKYLRVQRQQGYWRVWLHLRHAGHARGDSYSSLLDHVQPPLAMLCLPGSLLALVPGARWLALLGPALLLLAQVPLTARLVARTRRADMLAFAPMSFLRAFWRGVGMSLATVHWLLRRLRTRAGDRAGAVDEGRTV